MAHREVAALSCTVSLLCAFERAASWQDWSIGVHGLIIEFFGALQALGKFSVALYITAITSNGTKYGVTGLARAFQTLLGTFDKKAL
jgi:hypothetical protein